MNREQSFLLLAIVFTGLVSLVVVFPFLEFILVEIIFSYILYHACDPPELPPIGQVPRWSRRNV